MGKIEEGWDFRPPDDFTLRLDWTDKDDKYWENNHYPGC